MENVSSVRPTGKFPEKVENLKPGRLVYPVGTFRTELRVQFTRFWLFIPVPGPRQKHLSRPVRKTKWLPPSLHSCTSAQFVFFATPSKWPEAHWQKLCRDVAATGSILQGNRFGKPQFLSSDRFWLLFGSWLIQKWWDPFRIGLT